MTDLRTDEVDAALVEPDRPLQWAPTEPRPRKPRWGLRLGIPAAVIAVGAVAASLVLIAPGTAVAGVPVGFLTAGAAADAIAQRLATTSVTLGEGGPTLTGEDLGATVDAGELAATAFETHPLWNVSQWYPESASGEISLDVESATASLRSAVPDLFVDPVPAAVTATADGYVVTPAVAGEGVDVAAIERALQSAFAEGRSTVTIDAEVIPVEAAASTANAQAAAADLNAIIAEAGFYVGDERTVPISAAVAASLLSVDVDDAGTFTISADAAKIQPLVEGLAARVDRDAVDGTVVTDSEGEVLRTVVETIDGRVLGDVSDLATAFAAQLSTGDGSYALPVTVTPAKTTQLARMIEVDLSKQRIYLKENGEVVDTWLISSGRPGALTYTGTYSIGWKTSLQTMSGTSRDTGKAYEQPDVPWVMYFNGDQAFHGAYWHNNFGNQMSAGCVNMPPWQAKILYDWTPPGTDVWIHG